MEKGKGAAGGGHAKVVGGKLGDESSVSLDEFVCGGGHEGVFDLVVPYLSGHDLFRGLAATSNAFEAAARAGGRRWMKRRYEHGENKLRGLYFGSQSEEGFEVAAAAAAAANAAAASTAAAGSAGSGPRPLLEPHIADAARWGYRSALALECFESDDPHSAVLWRAELASNPSEKSGGKCRWCAYYLAELYKSPLPFRWSERLGELASAEVWGAWGARNFPRAIELYHEAADERGNSLAMYMLSNVYKYGTLGVDRDEAKELDYLRRASDAGHASASGKLAARYENGELGLDVNLAEAAILYKSAAEKEADTATADVWSDGLARVNAKIAEEGRREQQQ